MSRPSQVIVVAEDNRQQMFIYRYLLKTGFSRHAITAKRSPSGLGSAENWVRKQFPREVSSCRNRQTRAQSALIVIVDADTHTVRHRITQLDAMLTEARKRAITQDEPILRLVPKRNIETWILCLNGDRVDESADYKDENHNWNELITPAAVELYRWTRPNFVSPDHCCESLRTALTEFGRLPI